MTSKLFLQCRIASCSRHARICIPTRGYRRVIRRWELGVSQRIAYGSVGCVPPVVCCAGIVYGGNRRLGYSGFGKAPPRRRTPRAGASHRSSHQAALRSSALPARRSDVALGCRHRAHACPRPGRRQCQPRVGRCSVFKRSGCRFASGKRVESRTWSRVSIQSKRRKLRRHGGVRRVRFVQRRR